MKITLTSRYALLGVIAFIWHFAIGVTQVAALDIAPMTWATHPVTNPDTLQTIQQPNRSDWINVMGAPYDARGDGTTDDTAAIQAAFNVVNGSVSNLATRTVYFPPGNYKITSTLHIANINGFNLVGCGLNTIIKWAGLTNGGAMLWTDSVDNARYVGLVWDGGGTVGNTTVGASCAYEDYSSSGGYGTQIRHENESFRNFYATATYLPPDGNFPGGYPAAAIISGFVGAQVTGELTIFNCCFKNCATAIHNAVDDTQNYMWVIDGCEFDNNGIGFDGEKGDGYVLMNSHFQQSSIADIQYGTGIRGQRLTSSGSAQFFYGVATAAFQDCWVDGWTNPSCAMEYLYSGQGSVVDCSFTNPPAGASSPIFTLENTGDLEAMLFSNNYAPGFPSGVGLPPGSGILHEYGGPPLVDWVPAGSMGSNLTSGTETFLNPTAIADGPHIYDVVRDYGALPGGDAPNLGLANDCTAAIQSAINAASTANNWSIVYIPGGYYKITSTLNLPAGKYTVEGEGYCTQLCWSGGSNGTMMTVSNPTTITVRQLQLSAAWNMTGTSGYNSGFPVCDNTTITSLKETATGTSNATYDNVMVSVFGYGNPAAVWSNTYSPGLVLSNLPATATVYIPVMGSPLTVVDCGQAKIYSKMAYMGLVNVSGATHPKTGFLGLMVAEGGQNYGFSGTANNGLYNITVNDNQNLLVGAYYTEEEGNDVSLLRGAGTTLGRVAIGGIQAAATASPSSTAINVNNYAGRLFYGSSCLENNWGGYVVQVQQTGANPIDMMLTNNFFDGSSTPTFTLGAGANLIATLNQYGIVGTSDYAMTDTPNPLTAANLASLASSLDDFRQLGALNLAVEYGPANPLMINPSGLVAYWKLDETVSPSADSSMSGITGTWMNSPTSSTAKPTAIPYVDARSVSLNGTNQYIDMGNPGALPSGTHARTICGWGKLNNTTASYSWIAAFGTNTFGNAMFIGMNGTTLYAGGGQGADLTVPGFWDANWHFIVLTYDGTTAKLYADGVLKTSAAKSWNLVPHACNIGRMTDGTQYWNGQVDDVRVYNRALSATEISQLAGVLSGVGSLITGVTATTTSTIGGGNPNFTASNNSLVAGPSGILGASDSLGDCGFNGDDYSDFGNVGLYLAGGANITYDLGAKYNVSNLLIWNYSQPGSDSNGSFVAAGANSVQILSSTDNISFTTVGTYTFNQAVAAQYNSPRPIPGNNPPHPVGGAATEPAQVLPVSIPNARYIKLVLLSNHGWMGGGVGVNEVNFLGTSVP